MEDHIKHILDGQQQFFEKIQTSIHRYEARQRELEDLVGSLLSELELTKKELSELSTRVDSQQQSLSSSFSHSPILDIEEVNPTENHDSTKKVIEFEKIQFDEQQSPKLKHMKTPPIPSPIEIGELIYQSVFQKSQEKSFLPETTRKESIPILSLSHHSEHEKHPDSHYPPSFEDSFIHLSSISPLEIGPYSFFSPLSLQSPKSEGESEWDEGLELRVGTRVAEMIRNINQRSLYKVDLSYFKKDDVVFAVFSRFLANLDRYLSQFDSRSMPSDSDK
ncbi:hypothetical protein ADUPG1_008471 [Aduncisulcus paluster]|uniref:Uncharacterized protein n=1 Tax=Aduncisulcus paluster TaxID=2918883 RepID=A0ABQ5KS37_9EUKA|nr:hypothetical protein ADUPG1_008471 [Aduncisulcus paluster]